MSLCVTQNIASKQQQQQQQQCLFGWSINGKRISHAINFMADLDYKYTSIDVQTVASTRFALHTSRYIHIFSYGTYINANENSETGSKINEINEQTACVVKCIDRLFINGNIPSWDFSIRFNLAVLSPISPHQINGFTLWYKLINHKYFH